MAEISLYIFVKITEYIGDRAGDYIICMGGGGAALRCTLFRLSAPLKSVGGLKNLPSMSA